MGVIMEQEQLDSIFCEFLNELATGKDYDKTLWSFSTKYQVTSEALHEMYEMHMEAAH